MQKIHISEIDRLCKTLNAGRIPSNYNDVGEPEQEYYDEDEGFLVERYDGTPMSMSYKFLKWQAVIDEQ